MPKWLDRWCDVVGPRRLSSCKDLDKVVTLAVGFAQEGREDVRRIARRILARVQACGALTQDRLARCVPDRALPRLKDILERAQGEYSQHMLSQQGVSAVGGAASWRRSSAIKTTAGLALLSDEALRGE